MQDSMEVNIYIRELQNIIKKEESETNQKLLENLKQKISDEIVQLSNDIISTLDKTISAPKTEPIQIINLTKSKADFYRYICEVAEGKPKEQAIAGALECYQKAYDTAKSSLDTQNPVYLGVVLNFSVFKYYQNEIPEAVEMSKNCVEEVLKIAKCNDKQSLSILGLIKDNLCIWTTEMEDEFV